MAHRRSCFAKRLSLMHLQEMGNPAFCRKPHDDSLAPLHQPKSLGTVVLTSQPEAPMGIPITRIGANISSVPGEAQRGHCSAVERRNEAAVRCTPGTATISVFGGPGLAVHHSRAQSGRRGLRHSPGARSRCTASGTQSRLAPAFLLVLGLLLMALPARAQTYPTRP